MKFHSEKIWFAASDWNWVISDCTYKETTSFVARKLASCIQFQFKPERFVDIISVDNFITEQDTKRCDTFAHKEIWV